MHDDPSGRHGQEDDPKPEGNRFTRWAQADYDEAHVVRRLTRTRARTIRRAKRLHNSSAMVRTRQAGAIAAVAIIALVGLALLVIGMNDLHEARDLHNQAQAAWQSVTDMRQQDKNKDKDKDATAGTSKTARDARQPMDGSQADRQEAIAAVDPKERDAIAAITDLQNQAGSDIGERMKPWFPDVDQTRYQGFNISPLTAWNQGRTPCTWSGYPQSALNAGDGHVAFTCTSQDGHVVGMASALWHDGTFSDFDARIDGVGVEGTIQ